MKNKRKALAKCSAKIIIFAINGTEEFIKHALQQERLHDLLLLQAYLIKGDRQQYFNIHAKNPVAINSAINSDFFAHSHEEAVYETLESTCR